jgi:hypothetical protein
MELQVRLRFKAGYDLYYDNRLCGLYGLYDGILYALYGTVQNIIQTIVQTINTVQQSHGIRIPLVVVLVCFFLFQT